MFQYKEEKQGFFLENPENKKNYFGPFNAIFIRNKKLGNYKEKEELKQYENYKYCLGFGNKKIFILDKNGINKIINYE